MIRLKFCGLMRPADAAVAASIEASYAGVILSESSRQVTPRRAIEIFSEARGVRRVGVFRHRSVAEIIDEARTIGLDVIQLHGRFRPDEVEQVREGFDGAIWSVIPFDQAQPKLPEWWEGMADRVDGALLDTSVGGQSGGTGRTFDWTKAAPLVDIIREHTEIVLAGGLTPSNVAEAVRTLSPSVVDVSSGVESSPGVKDPSLMQAFAERARSASIV
jgi:phosphoribosylanthranilate isomerase